ncbi:MAG: tetratricopeptide repeat protein [Syntrophaceae bacterium]|nr:tetratricopeptide repeat protein [Syntrophaceae bacterium]
MSLIWVLFFLLIPFSSGQAASPGVLASLDEKVERWEVEEAWTEVQSLLKTESRNPQVLELAAKVAFHRGEYGEAKKLIQAALETGGDDEKRRGFSLFIESTLGVLSSFQKFESPHFIIHLDEKQDGILVDYLKDNLERTYRVMADRYDFRPKEKVRVEVFPDTKAFYLCSTLSARDIEVAGAVGLAQFNKLLILSPRALVYGYRWMDSLSHEYLHYLILKLSANKAPIWFHEGLAKYEETRWRGGPSYLNSVSQTLLAQALGRGKLISWDRMENSFIKLETPEEVQLAYAQAASVIDFLLFQAGDQGLREVLRRMGDGSAPGGARQAVEQVLGWPFSEFSEKWKEFLARKDLREMEGVHARRYKIKEGKSDEERVEINEIKSLIARNRAHLGDRLKERGRMEAAVLEYRRALAESRESVPVMNRLSDTLIRMNRAPEALKVLREAGALAPDHPTIYNYMGKAYLQLQDFSSARGALEESIQINPFNPEVHQNLALAAEKMGDLDTAARSREILRKLIR